MLFHIQPVPKDEFILTNMVYCHPMDMPSTTDETDAYVKINGCIYILRPDPVVYKGSIVMSALQRISTRTAVMDQLIVEPVPCPHSSCRHITLEIDELDEHEQGPTNFVGSNVFGELFRKEFRNHVFMPRQEFVMRYPKTVLKAKVLDIDFGEEETGVIGEDTEVEVTLAPRSALCVSNV